MNIAFFYEYGNIDEIGFGHKYRSEAISDELARRGHNVFFYDGCANADVLVIDHMFSQEELILKNKDKKIVLIDGAEEDTDLVDLSISAFVNKKSKYTGIEYIAFPMHPKTTSYCMYREGTTVFVGLGGYDRNNYVRVVIDALEYLKLDYIIAPSINHDNLNDLVSFPDNIWHDDNYFEAMKFCAMAITNGGLTMFQALHYGMPTVAIPQYDHQKYIINNISGLCLSSTPIVEHQYQDDNY